MDKFLIIKHKLIIDMVIIIFRKIELFYLYNIIILFYEYHIIIY